MTDNPAPVVDNQAPVTEVPGQNNQTQKVSWKSHLSADLQGSPLVSKFDDSPEGLNQAFASHNNLETLLGHEKVPIPKGPEDTEGWNRFQKAMGIPDAADGYGLPDAQLPDSMKGITIDKAKFAEVVHAHKLTPAQAKGLWETYQAINIDTYQKHKAALEQQITETANKLRGEWGDAYDSNVELAQAVINKFGTDQEGIDFITSTMLKDPRGAKFLAAIGSQFAENKIGDFSMKRFSLAPEEAQNEIDKMVSDLNGPYMNTTNKFTAKEHEAAVDRVNYLRASINKSRG